MDRPHQVRWDYRRLRDYDTARDLHLPPPVSNWSISLVIEAVQIDPETEVLARGMMGADTLPSYGAATHDVVLDMGPDLQCDDDYRLQPMREMDVTDQPILPPSYREASSSSPTQQQQQQQPLPVQPPPAYDAVDSQEQQQQDQSTTTTNVNQTTSTTVLSTSTSHS